MNPPNPISPNTPAYAAIAADLRKRIQNGELSPGVQLPTERQLADEWGVSGIVAREAVTTLKTEGLAYGRQGKGTYVAERPALTRIAPTRYRRGRSTTTYVEEATAAGQDPDIASSTSHIRAPDHIAERLGIDPGDMVSDTEYLIRMDGIPVTSSHAYEPLDITGGTPIEWPDRPPYGHLGIVDRFDTLNHHVQEVEEILTFRAPTELEASHLAVPPGVGVIEIQQAFRTDSRTVEVADIVYPSNRYRFIYRMPVLVTTPPPITKANPQEPYMVDPTFGEAVPVRPDGCPECGAGLVSIYAHSCWRCEATFEPLQPFD